MKMHDFLLTMQEPMPKWLSVYKQGDPLDVKKILSSRIVYYPGSRYDGQPMRAFNQSHFTHLFISADYGVDQLQTKQEFLEHGFRGYHALSIVDFSQKDITPRGWEEHLFLSEEQSHWIKSFSRPPFGFIAILERDSGFGEEHGSQRFAVIFLGADGIATYDALFGNKICKPHLLVLQDHGFGGNYDRFGAGGLMEKIANVTKIFPKYILCAENTDIWPGYSKIENVEAVNGGESCHVRHLWKRD